MTPVDQPHVTGEGHTSEPPRGKAGEVSAARRHINLLERLGTESLWRELMVESRMPLPAPFLGRQLLLRLTAAIELRESEEIDQVVEVAKQKGIPAVDSIRLANCLMASNRPDTAWKVLSAIDAAEHVWRVANIAKKIAGRTKSPHIRVEAGAFAATLLPDMFKPAPLSAVTSPFGPDDVALTASNGSLHIVHVDPALIERADESERLMAHWDAFLETTKKPTLETYTNVTIDPEGRLRQISTDSDETAPREVGTAISLLASTRGFFHWYCETIQPLALRGQPGWDPETVLLLRDNPLRFELDLLDLLGFPRDRIVRVDKPIRCERLLMGPHTIKNLQYWDAFAPLYDALAAAARPRVPAARHIYISRRDTVRRVMTNEADVEAMVSSLGIEPVVMSSITLAEQIGVVRDADLIVAPHGAGLAHIVNAKPGTRIVELMPAREGWDFIRFNFARLSRLRGHDHTLWLENSNPLTHSWSVNVSALRDFLVENAFSAGRG